MIDVHAHFAEEGYSFPEEWEKITNAGVTRVILAGDSIAHSEMHREFCKNHAGAFFAAGVHPENAGEWSKEELARFSALCRDGKCVAVGEIGLDYHYPDPDKKRQRDTFIRQILLAETFSLPVQIHSRDACADTLAVIKEMKAHLGAGFLLHCYSYGKENMSAFSALGAYFSFGGVTCFKNAKNVWESVRACPADRILTETDSPYLSPFRGEKNSPANISVITKKIAELRGETFNDLEKIIEKNAETLFYKLK